LRNRPLQERARAQSITRFAELQHCALPGAFPPNLAKAMRIEKGEPMQFGVNRKKSATEAALFLKL
jgi:hypothetical protein